MFWLKKLATLLLMPLFAGLTLVWTGLILSRTRRLKRYAGLLVAAGALPLTILSFQPVANEFIKPLEMCYPPPRRIQSRAFLGEAAKCRP